MSENKFDGMDYEESLDSNIYDVLPQEFVDAINDIRDNPPDLDWKLNQDKMNKFVEAVATLCKLLPRYNARILPIDFSPNLSHKVICAVPEPMGFFNPKELNRFYEAAAKFDEIALDFSQEGTVIVELKVNDVYSFVD